MNQKEVVRYFRILSKFYRHPCTVILTGAGAGTLYGNIRATMDLDFALKLKARSPHEKEKLWQEFAAQTRQVTLRTGVAVQYAEDIDRWSAITLLDYADHTRPFQKFGKIEVRLLDPCYWAIGKLARSLEPDLKDLAEVLRKTKTPWQKLARLMGRALRQSPKSTACYQFRRQVEHFLSAAGPQIWGKGYSSEKAVRIFQGSAKIQ